jgi:esterase/lipase superfamily enzyme
MLFDINGMHIHGKKILLRHLFFTAIITFLFVDTVVVNAEPNQQKKETIVERQTNSIPVPYVTLRNRTESSKLSEYYGGSRGQLRAGICTVSFSPIWGLDEIAKSVPFYIPDETIKLADLQEIQLDRLFNEIAQFPQKNDGNIVIYIHGYNIDFEKSCRRSALFQRALGLHDRLLLFSWPSEGNMLKYTWDEADLVWSVSLILLNSSRKSSRGQETAK